METELACPIQPLGNFVVIKRIEACAVSPGGIIIPETSREKPAKGIVVAVGPGRMHASGVVEEVGVEPEQMVLFEKYKGTDIEVNGEQITILRSEHILAIEMEESCPASSS